MSILCSFRVLDIQQIFCALDQCCRWRVLDIQWYDFVRSADVCHITEQPFSTVKSRHLSLFRHVARDWMEDINQILSKPIPEPGEAPPPLGDRTPPDSIISPMT